MTFWESRFRDHAVWIVVEQARVAMNGARMPEAEDQQEALAFAGSLLELLEKRRTETSPRDISLSMLQTLQQVVQQFTNAVSNATSGGWQWSQVIPAIDDVLNSLASWPPLTTAHYLSGINAAARSFQDKMAAAVAETTQAAARAADEMARAATEAAETTARAAADAAQKTAAAVTAVEQQQAALTQKQAELSAQISQERQRIAEQITAFTAERESALRAFGEEREAALDESNDAWSALMREEEEKAEAHEMAMQRYEERSRKVLEAVGRNSTATDYGAYANSQGTTANVWRIIAAVVFALAGAWFVYTSLHAVDAGTITWEASFAKLGVTAAVAGVGAYAARESSLHRRNEREARRVQLVLTALEPFIANLDTEEQEKVRAESARAIFVLKPELTSRAEARSGSPWIDIIRELVEKVPDSAK